MPNLHQQSDYLCHLSAYNHILELYLGEWRINLQVVELKRLSGKQSMELDTAYYKAHNQKYGLLAGNAIARTSHF